MEEFPFQNSRRGPHPKYRSDIDGLRAIAILCVIIFHGFPTWLQGGFIGVDIFFVISGFLITTIILNGLEHDTFSFAAFYSHRVKRIFPALLLVFVACAAFGWFTLFSDEYEQLGKHIASGATFLSNFILWGENGYFDNDARTKPLLHLWSLSIEEQFYILWPFLCWITWKRGWNILTLILIGAIASFMFNIYEVSRDTVGAFYLPGGRFWELMIGAALAHLMLYEISWLSRLRFHLNAGLNAVFYLQPEKAGHETLINLQSICGFALIISGLGIIKQGNGFPGWLALLPTCGAVLIISAGPRAWLNQYVLSHRAMVWLGLISYPLYLWHWPLLSFANIMEGGEPSRPLRIAAILVAVSLGWLTYMGIEKPIRLGKANALKTAILLFLMIVVGSYGYYIFMQQGFIDKVSRYGQLGWKIIPERSCQRAVGAAAGFCSIRGNAEHITMAVIGDSTANALMPGLAEIFATKDRGIINTGQWSCPPVQGLIDTKAWDLERKDSAQCMPIVSKIYDFLSKNSSIKVVILSFYSEDLKFWGLPGVSSDAPPQARFQLFKQLLDHDIEQLKKDGKDVILTYDVLRLPFDPRNCLVRPFSSSAKITNCTVSLETLLETQSFLNFFDTYYSGRKDVCVFRQSDLMNERGVYNVMDKNGELYLRDDHHLSLHGSEAMAQKLMDSDCMKKFANDISN